jgi:hypothetical protein
MKLNGKLHLLHEQFYYCLEIQYNSNLTPTQKVTATIQYIHAHYGHKLSVL